MKLRMKTRLSAFLSIGWLFFHSDARAGQVEPIPVDLTYAAVSGQQDPKELEIISQIFVNEGFSYLPSDGQGSLPITWTDGVFITPSLDRVAFLKLNVSVNDKKYENKLYSFSGSGTKDYFFHGITKEHVPYLIYFVETSSEQTGEIISLIRDKVGSSQQSKISSEIFKTANNVLFPSAYANEAVPCPPSNPLSPTISKIESLGNGIHNLVDRDPVLRGSWNCIASGATQLYNWSPLMLVKLLDVKNDVNGIAKGAQWIGHAISASAGAIRDHGIDWIKNTGNAVIHPQEIADGLKKSMAQTIALGQIIEKKISQAWPDFLKEDVGVKTKLICGIIGGVAGNFSWLLIPGLEGKFLVNLASVMKSVGQEYEIGSLIRGSELVAQKAEALVAGRTAAKAAKETKVDLAAQMRSTQSEVRDSEQWMNHYRKMMQKSAPNSHEFDEAKRNYESQLARREAVLHKTSEIAAAKKAGVTVAKVETASRITKAESQVLGPDAKYAEAFNNDGSKIQETHKLVNDIKVNQLALNDLMKQKKSILSKMTDFVKRRQVSPVEKMAENSLELAIRTNIEKTYQLRSKIVENYLDHLVALGKTNSKEYTQAEARLKDLASHRLLAHSLDMDAFASATEAKADDLLENGNSIAAEKARATAQVFRNQASGLQTAATKVNQENLQQVRTILHENDLSRLAEPTTAKLPTLSIASEEKLALISEGLPKTEVNNIRELTARLQEKNIAKSLQGDEEISSGAGDIAAQLVRANQEADKETTEELSQIKQVCNRTPASK